VYINSVKNVGLGMGARAGGLGWAAPPPYTAITSTTTPFGGAPAAKKLSVDGGDAVLMIVPVPNRHGLNEDDFTLCAVHPDNAMGLRSATRDMFEPFAADRPHAWSGDLHAAQGMAPRGGGLGGPPPLQVQHVGSYQVGEG
jgi:hypothetical protein